MANKLIVVTHKCKRIWSGWQIESRGLGDCLGENNQARGRTI